jgi:TatD DNase family protein
MIIDSHAHLNFKLFQEDQKEVIERCLANQVWMINVGSQLETSQEAVKIAQEYNQGVYASVGLHPIHADQEFDYKKTASQDKVVAIGETGLDYYYQSVAKEKQKKVFLEQLEVSLELNKPVVLHCRKAHRELLDIIKSFDLRGVIHCFTGSWSEAQKYLDLGLKIGFTGIIFKLNLKEVIEKVPLDGILVETDCPYLSPPGRPERNEPLFVEDIIKEIARIKKISYQEVKEKTVFNTRELFKI